jgi:hypothetical protein
MNKRLFSAVLIVILGVTAGGAALAAELVSAASEQGSPSFHRHLVRPGAFTTYVLTVKNPGPAAATVSLVLAGPETPGFSAALAETSVSLPAGGKRDVLLTLRAAPGLAAGQVATVTVTASAGGIGSDAAILAAETALQRKIYFLSIDSLDPRYLELDAAGTGLGREGDWLMPNLHRLMGQAVFYPNNKVHIITATDMNHFNYLAGTMTGTSGISLVGGFIFGFDDHNQPIIKNSANIEQDLARYGAEGKHVDTLYNAAKAMNPNAWTAFVSGKNWVPELYRRPEFQIDRIVHGMRVPEFIAPAEAAPPAGVKFLGRAVRALLPGPRPSYAHDLGNPAGLPGPQDRREQSPLGRLMGISAAGFPNDAWVMDAAIAEIEQEDPDVLYVLLAAVDDAGHAYGSAFDLTEWDGRGTPGVEDDVSKFDPRASRQGILNSVREADRQSGRFLDLLAARGALDDSIVVFESDHSMVTYYRDALDAKAQLRRACPYKMDRDYFFGGAADIGLVIARQPDPAIVASVEKALEAWRVKNPIGGQEECPVLVFNRQEMKTGFDLATGKQWMLPGEYYSEYFIEHRREGEQVWADLLVLSAPNYKFKVQNFGLGNLGVAKLPFKLPEWGFFIGGHGSFETRSALLMVKTPGTPAAVNPADVYAMDVAPTLFRLNGWPLPASVDGKGLPGLDPERK